MPANGLPNKALDNREQIIQRIAAGERVTDIAKSLGYLSHSTISKTLSGDPDYQQAVIHSAWAKLETREEQLEQAEEQVDVTRARELLSHARWMAERLNREQFAQKADTQVNINLINVDGVLGQNAASLLDQLRTVVAPQQSDEDTRIIESDENK